MKLGSAFLRPFLERERSKMSNCKTIAIANQKGGVGKTTTTVSLGVGLVNHGKRVLLVDADPQGDLTTSLGCNGPMSILWTQKVEYFLSA